MHDNVNELNACDHEFEMENVVVNKVIHESLEASHFLADNFEIIKRRENDLMASFNQTNSGQEFQDKRFGSKRFVDKTKGNAIDGLPMLDHHIEAIFIVHDCTQAHDAHMNVVRRGSHVQFADVTRPAFHVGTVGGQELSETWPKETIGFRVVAAASGRGERRVEVDAILFGFGTCLFDALLVAHHR